MISWKKKHFYINLIKNITVSIAKDAYFDTIKEIKINRILPVNLEL